MLCVKHCFTSPVGDIIMMKTMLFQIIFILGFLLIPSFAFFRRFSEEVETDSTNTTLTTRVKGDSSYVTDEQRVLYEKLTKDAFKTIFQCRFICNGLEKSEENGCSEYLPRRYNVLWYKNPSERILPGYEDVSRTTRFENCSPEIYEPTMLEYKVAFTTRFIEDGPLSCIQLEICDTKELNYKTSMESLHGIESTALLATFILTVLSMRIVSEEQLIKDTVSHSLIVKTTTNEARQNLPTKAEEEAVRHCELCINHDQAIAYCMTCKLYICMPCNGLHKRVWTLMNHTVCPFNHM